MKSIEEINKVVQSEISVGYKRPKQIMDQDKFNAFMLKTLNDLALKSSKGERQFQIIEENVGLLTAVFAYLNRSENDELLKYTKKIKVDQLDGSGNVIKTEYKPEITVLSLEKGLAIIGNFGIGKTLLLKAIQTNMRELGLTGRFFTARQIFESYKVTAKEAYELKQADLFQVVGPDKYGCFLDDLGAEPGRTVKFGEEDTPAGNFIMHRLNEWDRLRMTAPEQMIHDPKMFVTSNVPIESLKNTYGGRVISRLYGACNVIISNQKTDFRKA